MLQIVSGKNVSAKDIEEAVLLDELSYPEQYRGNVDDCLKWAKKNPDIYVMLRDLQTGRIIAYANIMPLKREQYDMLRSGKFIDTGMTPEMISTYDSKNPNHVYFSSIVIHPEYRGIKVFKRLLDAITTKLVELSENGIFIQKMLADAVSPSGEKFCRLLGMEKICDSDHGSAIYEILTEGVIHKHDKMKTTKARA